MTFAALWAELEPIGRHPTTGGYLRGGLTSAERLAHAWLLDQCRRRGLELEADTIGNVVAWWRPDGDDTRPGVLTGSHLDSVPQGGAFDGPLGIVSALAAIDQLRDNGFVPDRPIGVVAWLEEEGARFGMPCLGSRLATGALDPLTALALRDRDGLTLPEAYDRAELEIDPTTYGSSQLLKRVQVFVELHVEQGVWLADPPPGSVGGPVGVATAIWPHGRWRFDLSGRADHAGATRMEDRADPMLTAAFAALAANEQARQTGGRATMGRLEINPGATNAVPEQVRAWLDARAADEASLESLVSAVETQVIDRAEFDGTTATLHRESMSPGVDFDAALRDQVAAVVGAAIGGGAPAPLLPTAAGHDAALLAAAGVPSAMLFVRNPTGVSHSPAEHAELDDCEAGVEALAAVLADLAGPSRRSVANPDSTSPRS